MHRSSFSTCCNLKNKRKFCWEKKTFQKRSLPRLLNKRQQFHLDVTWTKHFFPLVKRLLIFCPQRRSGPASFTQFNRWPDCQTKQITKSQRINSINYTEGQKIIKPHTRRFFVSFNAERCLSWQGEITNRFQLIPFKNWANSWLLLNYKRVQNRN